MSPRKRTIDDIDDVDDQDGALQQEVERGSDLSLKRKRADDVALGGAPETRERNSRLRDLQEEDLEPEG